MYFIHLTDIDIRDYLEPAVHRNNYTILLRMSVLE